MNRRSFLTSIGLSTVILGADREVSFGQVPMVAEELHRNFPTMVSRHEHYKRIANAIHDYGVDIYFFDVAALVTAPYSGFGSADKKFKINLTFGETTNQFLSLLNARLFEQRNVQLAAQLLTSRNLEVDGKKFSFGPQADIAILEGEQQIAQRALDATPQRSLIVKEINESMNMFADNVQAGNPAKFFVSKLPGVIGALGEAAVKYGTKRLMYVYSGREALRQATGQPLLQLDYGKYEHRIAMGKACLAQARAEGSGLLSVTSRSLNKVAIKLTGQAGQLQSTGLYVAQGEKLVVSATGLVASKLFLRGIAQSPPEGVSTKPNISPPASRLPFLSLVTVVVNHQITSNGNIVSSNRIVGSGSTEGSWVSPLSGVVCVLVNDANADDNSGFFDATVEVRHG